MISHLLPDTLCLEIPPLDPVGADFSTSGAHWRARVNQLCLNAILPWLKERHQAKGKASPNTWEFVNGTKVDCDHLRLILMPSTAIDQSELRVPQEWVDIPSWSGDYYLAIQVNASENWLSIWGYATHHQLKTQGRYDAGDRTYSLTEDQLIQDINVLWIAQQLEVPDILQAAIAPIPPLPIPQSKTLIERLGNPAVIFPRLAVPFSLWAGLMEHSGWRQQLHERRQGLSPQRSIVEWLQSGVSSWAEQSGWGVMMRPAAQGVRSVGQSGVARSLTIGDRPYELRIFPQGSTPNTWRFELSATDLIPADFILRVLTEDLQPFEHNEDTAEGTGDRLYVDVVLEPGEGLVWEIMPTPNDYQQEVLYF
jgi:Protein of unknown function (DUF1822)